MKPKCPRCGRDLIPDVHYKVVAVHFFKCYKCSVIKESEDEKET